VIGAALALAAGLAGPTVDADPLALVYHAYVCAESDDVVQLVRFGPAGLEKLRDIPVGRFPTEIEGPHGISVSPDGLHFYVSLAHGLPYGSIHRYRTETDAWEGDVTVGMFPATIAVSPSTDLLYVVNFDLFGPMEPSSISVVETTTMMEVDRIETGVMPHGARLDASGSRLYSVNMMDDELIEVDALRFEVARRLRLGPGHSTEPTWVTSPTPRGKVYVAGNGTDTVYEVDLETWRVVRRLVGGRGPYNVDATPDGTRLVVTYKKDAAVGFWNLDSGVETSRIPTSRRVPHGVAVTPDGRFAFVTVEGVGGEPGAVEVYAVERGERVAQLDVGKQAGGIALWNPGR